MALQANSVTEPNMGDCFWELLDPKWKKGRWNSTLCECQTLDLICPDDNVRKDVESMWDGLEHKYHCLRQACLDEKHDEFHTCVFGLVKYITLFQILVKDKCDCTHNKYVTKLLAWLTTLLDALNALTKKLQGDVAKSVESSRSSEKNLH